MIPSSPYIYVQGPDNLGVGVQNYAVVQPHPDPEGGHYRRKDMVRNQWQTRRPAYPSNGVIDLPNTDLRANGAYLSGQMALQALSEFEKGKQG